MSPHSSKNSAQMVWPDLDSSYVDEVGPIDQSVYEIVQKLWPAIVPAIHRTIRDLEAGQTLMIKAAAAVSRKLREPEHAITNVHGYLYKTFIHLLTDELEKQTKHAQIERVILAQTESRAGRSDDEIYRIILVHEVLARSDKWTRSVFELLTLGHSFEEIALKYGMQSNHLRSRWSKEMRRLAKLITAETRAAELEILSRGARRR